MVGLDGYCQKMYENELVGNRLREDIGLFLHIVNLKELQKTPVVVLLNAYDSFLRYLRNGYQFSEYFKDFNDNDGNIQDIIEYVINLLLDQIRISKWKRLEDIHFVVTNALSEKCMKDLFVYVRRLLRQNATFPIFIHLVWRGYFESLSNNQCNNYNFNNNTEQLLISNTWSLLKFN